MVVAALAVPLCALRSQAAQKPLRDFFAMDNGLKKTRSLDDKAKLLKELGYAGIGWRPGRTAEMLAALDRHGLRMMSTYVRATAGVGGTFDPKLKDEVKLIRHHRTDVWLFVVKGKKASDDHAVRVVNEAADLAEAEGLRVVLYPHVGFYIDNIDDALRIVKKVDRKNVGLSFNLCHFLKRASADEIPEVLRKVAPHLFLVQLNGADAGDTKKMGWSRLIQPLDKGSFDNARVVEVLDEIGYRGPVALQLYRAPGSDRDNLAGSMKAWKRINGGTQ
jgi:sugar phosphate isomerase/epimerase